MGNNTQFQGFLKFTCDMLESDFARLSEIINNKDSALPNHIDLDITDCFSGIQWKADSEKTYGTTEALNHILVSMRKTKPEFGLSGKMFAQGEDFGDLWYIEIVDGAAVETTVDWTGTLYQKEEK